MNIEISEVIREYFSLLQYASPKKLLRNIYPLFKKRYPDEDTVRRIITRTLKHLKDEGFIVAHPITPYYYLKGSKMLDDAIYWSIAWKQNQLEKDTKFADLESEEKPVSFAEYFVKKKTGEWL